MPKLRYSIAGLMATVLVIAADCGLLRALFPTLPNPLSLIVLSAGFVWMVTRRGHSRAFWFGFELLGCTYFLMMLGHFLPIWRLLNPAYEFLVDIVERIGLVSPASDREELFYLSVMIISDFLILFFVASAGGLLMRGCYGLLTNAAVEKIVPSPTSNLPSVS